MPDALDAFPAGGTDSSYFSSELRQRIRKRSCIGMQTSIRDGRG